MWSLFRLQGSQQRERSLHRKLATPRWTLGDLGLECRTVSLSYSLRPRGHRNSYHVRLYYYSDYPKSVTHTEQLVSSLLSILCWQPYRYHNSTSEVSVRNFQLELCQRFEYLLLTLEKAFLAVLTCFKLAWFVEYSLTFNVNDILARCSYLTTLFSTFLTHLFLN